MSSPYLIKNGVGSMVPLVRPLDIRKFESSSYQALGARFNPYRAFLRRSTCIASIHAESAIASLIFFGSAVLTVSANIHFQDLLQVVVLFALASMDFHKLEIMGDLLSIGVQIDEVGRMCGVSCFLELSKGEEDLLTLEVPVVKISSYIGPNKRSNSCCDEAVVSAEGETFYSWGARPELS
ncbi:hypothetical protein Tco_0798752 [Tanacetum coccineum]